MLGGRWVKYEEVAEVLNISRDTVKNNLKKLADGGYIILQRKPYGVVIEVTNSKKWMVRQGTSSPSGQGENSPSDARGGESSPSSQGTSSPSGQGENSPSNGLYSLTEKENQKEAAAITTPENIEPQVGGVPSPDLPFEAEQIHNTDDTPDWLKLDQIDHDANFLTNYVLSKIGRHHLDGIDQELIRGMLKQGIPRDLMTRTIDDLTAKAHEAKKKIKYFRYFVDAIEERFKALQEIQAGEKQASSGSGYAAQGANSKPVVDLRERLVKQREHNGANAAGGGANAAGSQASAAR